MGEIRKSLLYGAKSTDRADVPSYMSDAGRAAFLQLWASEAGACRPALYKTR